MGSKDLDVAAVEASLGNQAALATRPHGQVDFRLVGTGLHGKPCKGSVNRSPGAYVLNHTSDVPALLFGQVRHHDRMEDNRSDAGLRIGKLNPQPVDRAAAVDRRWHAAGDFDHLGELVQTVGLVGPDEAEHGSTAFVESGIDRVQIAAAALDDANGAGHV